MSVGWRKATQRDVLLIHQGVYEQYTSSEGGMGLVICRSKDVQVKTGKIMLRDSFFICLGYTSIVLTAFQ